MKCGTPRPFLSMKAGVPAGQEQHIGSGKRMLTAAPRNFLDHDRLTAAAIDTPHRVEQKDQKSPERNELEAALGELVVSRGGFVAA